MQPSSPLQSGPTVTQEKDKVNTVPRRRTTVPRLSLFLIYLLSFIFLVLVEIGNTKDAAVTRSTYFIRVDLSHIVPKSVPNYVLVNSIARSIGLYDFYQVGLWNFCKGYNGEGIISCSKPMTLYWFNPVKILLNDLFPGASIALPGDIDTALELVKTASHWMFAFFTVATVLTFLCMFLAPFSTSSKPRYLYRRRQILLRSLPLTILTFLAAFFTVVASAVATVMFVIFRNVLTSQQDLSIEAQVGKQMFAFMWIASALNLIGFLWDLGNCCAVCCCSGKKKAKQRGLIDEHGNLVGEKRETSAGSSTAGDGIVTNPNGKGETATAAAAAGGRGIARMRRGLRGWRSKRVEHV